MRTCIFTLCFVLAAVCAFSQTPPWPQGRHDATHQGRSDSNGAQAGTLDWGVPLDQYPNAMASSAHRIYVAGQKIVALTEIGTTAWSFTHDSTTGVYYQDLAYSGAQQSIYATHEDVVETDPFLISIQTNGEQLNWRRHFADSAGLSVDDAVYYCSDGRISAVSPAGSLLWRRPACSTDVAVSSAGVIYAVYKDLNGESTLFGLRKDGSVVVRAQISNDSQDYFSSPAAGKGIVVVASSENGSLIALHTNGTLHWKKKFDGGVSAASIGSDGVVYVGTLHGLYALNPNGSTKWNAPIGDASRSIPAIGKDGTIYESSSNQHVYSIAPDGKLNWNIRVVGTPTSPIVGPANSTVVAAIDNGQRFTLYSIQ